jgi:hypothetical protein
VSAKPGYFQSLQIRSIAMRPDYQIPVELWSDAEAKLEQMAEGSKQYRGRTTSAQRSASRGFVDGVPV